MLKFKGYDPHKSTSDRYHVPEFVPIYLGIVWSY